MKTGEFVVCINDTFTNPRTNIDFKNLPKKGEIYTIRSIYPTGGLGEDTTGVLLVEITNPPIYNAALKGKIEPGFAAKRFCPLNEVPDGVLDEDNEEVVEKEKELQLI